MNNDLYLKTTKIKIQKTMKKEYIQPEIDKDFLTMDELVMRPHSVPPVYQEDGDAKSRFSETDETGEQKRWGDLW